MAGKKDDKPYLPFYIGDWFKAPEIRAMPHANRMVWLEILCLMWQSEERGYLTINKKPFVITNDITGEVTKGQQVLSSMLGISYEFLQESFKIFKEYGVYSVREDGAIYSRFMRKLVEIQSKRGKAGKIGMEKRWGKSVITSDITSRENEIDIDNENVSKKKKESIQVEKNTDDAYLELLIPSMEKIWKKNHPKYSFVKERDYPSLLKISYFIIEQENLNKNAITNSKKAVLEIFEVMTNFVVNDTHFRNYNIAQVEKYIQTISLNIQNGKSKQATGGEVNTQSAFDKIDKLYSVPGTHR